jgi:hypothetical protein
MAVNNVSGQEASLEGLTEWSSSPVHLKDFADTYGVPNVAKVMKGQYREVGVAKSVHSELYIHAVETSQKVLAEGVKVKEGKRVVISANQKYSLPLSYQGWFELLSQDGKAVKAITTVQELTRSFPANCIVRENIKVFIPRDNGELTLDKYRTLVGGEQLKLVGEIWVTTNTPKGIVKRRLLHCLDMKGESVYLGLEQKGLFSPIAGHTNISGVHNLRGLLDKFRFPILVRLVHGIIPSKLEKHFTGVFRLNGVYREESMFVCPLRKDAKMVPISTREPLKLVAAANLDELMKTDGYQYHLERCQRMIASYMNSIHLLFTMPDPTAVKAKKEEMERSNRSVISDKTLAPQGSEEDILFEEVEDIYAYVREGGPVPTARARPIQTVQTVQHTRSLQAAPSVPLHQPSDPLQSSPVMVEAKDASRQDSPQAGDIAINARRHHRHRNKQPAAPALFTPTKDDFWEEPIYEPLDKIRRDKSTKHEERIPAPVIRSPPSATEPIIIPPPAPTPGVDRSPSRRDAEVQNLRQVYKHSHENVSSRPAFQVSEEDIDELKDMLEDINAPPVPPKNFADPETGISPDPPIELKPDYDFPPGQPETDKPLAQATETIMTFDEDESEVKVVQQSSPVASPVKGPSPIPTSIAATTTTTTILHQSDIPACPEPTVIVHTPVVPEPSPLYTQSMHEVLAATSPPPAPRASPTFLYKTSLPLTAPTATHNGYSQPRGEHVHKVLLNSPDPQVHIVPPRRPASSAASFHQHSRPLGTAHVSSPGGAAHASVLHTGAHRPQGGLSRTPSSVAPYTNDAPYVAVARVGDVVTSSGFRTTDTRPFSRQRKMQSMYL